MQESPALSVSKKRSPQQGRSRGSRATLQSIPVDAARLIEKLETFFSDRAHLPQGAALVLSYFA